MAGRVHRLCTLLWSNAQGQTFTISLDASVNEVHRLSAIVTDHPVESGVNISDHVRPDLDRIEIEGVISNTPIILPRNFADGTQVIEVPIEGPPRTVGNTIGRPIPLIGALASRIPLPLSSQSGVARGFDPPFDRVEAVFQALKKIRDEGSLVRIYTTLRAYENMALENIEVTRNAANGNVLALNISAREVRVGFTRTVEVPAIPTKRTDKGTRAATAVTKPPPAEQRSMADTLFGSDDAGVEELPE